MAGKKILFTITLYILFQLFTVSSILATDVPNFPTCLNPQGDLIVSYSNGVHGVPGDSASYTGSDAVYKISDNALTQCLCTVNGNGIQTNWWKISSLDDGQLNYLKSQGWIFIPNGQVWGLEDSSYMALNFDYNCQTPQSGGNSNSGPSGGSSSSSNSSQSTSTAGQVLGLASTGNIVVLYAAFLLGFIFISLAMIFSKKRRS